MVTKWAGCLGVPWKTQPGGGLAQRCFPGSGPGPHRHWQVSSRHHQTRTLDYSYLLGLLEDMQAHWEEAASLPQEQVGSATRPENAVPGGCGVGLLGLGQAVRGRVFVGCTAPRDSRGLKTDKLHDAGESKWYAIPKRRCDGGRLCISAGE